MSTLIGFSSSPTKDDVFFFFSCEDHQQQTILNGKVGEEQSKYVYKCKLIACMYGHKLYIAQAMFQGWICSIIFLFLLVVTSGLVC